MLFTDEPCNHYNYFSFSARLFIFPGINNCLVFIYLVFYVFITNLKPIFDSCLTLFSRLSTHGIFYWSHLPEEGCSRAFRSAPIPLCLVHSLSSWCLPSLSFWKFLFLPVSCVSCLPLSWFTPLLSWNTRYVGRKWFWEFVCLKMGLFSPHIKLILWMGIKFKISNHFP